MRFARIAIAALFMTLTLQAQTTFTLQEEDDSLVSPALSSDRGYTNGTRLLWNWIPDNGSRLDRLASTLCHRDSQCDRTVTAGIGQNMYTPEDLKRSTPAIGDRPYGGWLYGTLMLDATRQTMNDHVELYAGVIGRDSHAADAQIFVHKHVTPGAQDPEGWGNQIGEWAAFLARYERRVKLVALRTSSGGPDWLDVTPAIGGAAGNVFVNGSASATVRLGYNLPLHFIEHIQAVPFVLKTKKTEGQVRQEAEGAHAPPDWDAFVYVVADASYSARDVFIDSEDTKYRIERRPFGRTHRAGTTFRIHHFRLAYQYTWRSSEFISRFSLPTRPHSYGMLMISVGPNP